MTWVLAIASSLMLALTVPGFNQHWLCFIALAPLFAASRREPRPVVRFFAGLAAGAVYWWMACCWIEFVLEVHGGMNLPLAWLAFFLFGLYKGLQMALFLLLAGWIPVGWFSPLAFAALWTGLEWTHVWTGFLWIPLGMLAALESNWQLMSLAPWTGQYGITFVYALIGALVALVAFYRRWLASALLLAAFLVLQIRPPVTVAEVGSQTAVIVQPAMPVSVSWTREFLDERLGRLTFQSFQSASTAEGHPRKLIIWPEMPSPIYYESDPAFHQLAADIAVRNGDYFLFGTAFVDKDQNATNSAVMLAPDSGLVGRYDKVNLVPFGEFVPPAFAWVNKITQEPGDAVPGSRLTLFPVEGEKAGVFICYESAYPDFVRQFANNGASFFVNLSNDGYFGRSFAREQHLALVRMRAAENQRWIVRATNNGITAVVNPSGQITERMPEWQETSAVMRYGIRHETTFYSRHGDWFAWLCLAVGLASCGRGYRFRSIATPAQ